MPEDTNSQFQTGQYDGGQDSSPLQMPKPVKSGGASLKYLTTALVVIAVAVIVYYVVFRSGAAKQGVGYSALEQSGSMAALTNTLSYGYNGMAALNASYSGMVSVGASIFSISLPFTLTVQKYGNDSVEHINVSLSNIASMFGSSGSSSSGSSFNLSLYYINGTSYICEAASTTKTCAAAENLTQIPAFASPSNLVPQLQNILQLSVLNKTSASASYNGSACTLFSEKTMANVNLSSLTRYSMTSGSSPTPPAGVPSIPSFPMSITTCLSNQYFGIPYNFSMVMSKLTIPSAGSLRSNMTMNISVHLNAQYINTKASQHDVDTLPYSLKSSLGSSAISGAGGGTLPVTSGTGGSTLPTVCVAQDGFLCRITSYSNGYLKAQIGQSTGKTMNNTFAFFLNDTASSAFQSNHTVPLGTPLSFVGNKAFDFYSGTASALNLSVDNNFTDISGQIWLGYNKNTASFCGFYNSSGCDYSEVGVVST